MKKKLLLLFFFIHLSLCSIMAQNGPGGIGDTTGNSSLQLWLKASDLENIYSDGDFITEWHDNSGAGNNVYANLISAPIFRSEIVANYSRLDFQGNQYLQTTRVSNSFNNPESTIFLVKTGACKKASIAIASNGWQNEMLLFGYGQYHHSSSGNFVLLEHPCLENIQEEELIIICGVFGQSPNDLEFIVNGYKSDMTPDLFGSPVEYSEIERKVTIGQRDQLLSDEFYEGEILEVIVYNSKLSEEEIYSVEEYLKCTYNLSPSSCSELSDDGCTSSSITQSKEKIEINIMPNPAKEKILINIKDASLINKAEFILYNALGKYLINDKIRSENTNIQIGNYSKGMYYLIIVFDGNVISKKIVIN